MPVAVLKRARIFCGANVRSLHSSLGATHRDALKGRGIEGPVDLIRNSLVIVIEVFKAQALLHQLGGGLVQGQRQSPNGIVGQWRLLETSCLFRRFFYTFCELINELL